MLLKPARVPVREGCLVTNRGDRAYMFRVFERIKLVCMTHCQLECHFLSWLRRVFIIFELRWISANLVVAWEARGICSASSSVDECKCGRVRQLILAWHHGDGAD